LRLSLFSRLCLRCVLSVPWLSEAQETFLQNDTHSYSAQYTLAWLRMFIHVSFSVGVSNLKRKILLFGVACKVKPSMRPNFDCCRAKTRRRTMAKDKTRQDDYKANQGKTIAITRQDNSRQVSSRQENHKIRQSRGKIKIHTIRQSQDKNEKTRQEQENQDKKVTKQESHKNKRITRGDTRTARQDKRITRQPTRPRRQDRPYKTSTRHDKTITRPDQDLL
jgi:hypothetical protein